MISALAFMSPLLSGPNNQTGLVELAWILTGAVIITAEYAVILSWLKFVFNIALSRTKKQ